MEAPKPAATTLALADEWKATRTAEGKWYFWGKGRETRWEAPAACGYITFAELDERYRNEHPGAPLPPATAAVARVSEKHLKTRHLASQLTSSSASWRVATCPKDVSSVGAGTWTHVAGSENLATDVASLSATASAIVATAPSSLSSDASAMAEWQRLTCALMGPDAALTPDAQQMLIAAPHEFRFETAHRAALLQVAASGISGAGGTAALLAGWCETYTSPASYSEGMAAAQAHLHAAAASSSSTLRGSSVTFADGGVPAAGASLRSMSGALISPPPRPEPGMWNAAGRTIANGRAIADFKRVYTRDVGSSMLANAASFMDWLATLIDGLLPHDAWRAAFVDLANKNAEDGFLAMIVTTMAEKGYVHDVAGCSVMATNLPVLQQVLIDYMNSRLSAEGAAQTPRDIRDAAALVSTEFSALYSLHVMQQVVAEALKGATTLTPAAARAARIRQDTGYAMLAAAGTHESMPSPWTRGLAVAPLHPAVMAPAEEVEDGDDPMTGGEASGAPATHALKGVFDAVAQLRCLALRLWPELRADMFVDERFPSQALAAAAAASRVTDAGKSVLAHDVSAAEADASAAQNLELERLRISSLCARPASAEDVRNVVRSLETCSGFMLSASDVEVVRGDLEAARAGPSSQATDQDIRARELGLGAYDFMAHSLAQPDVVALLVHMLFHPSVTVNEAGRKDVMTNTRLLSNALAWLLDCTGRIPRAAGTSFADSVRSWPAGVTDSCIPRELLGVHDSFEPGATGDAARTVAVSVISEALDATSNALKPHGVLASFTHLTATGLAFAASSMTVSPQQALTELINIIMRGTAIPAVSFGLLHWLRHALLVPGVSFDPRFTASSLIVLRACITLAHTHPFSHPTLLALLHEMLCVRVGSIDAASLRKYREDVVSVLGDLALMGYALPVLEYVYTQASASSAASSAWDVDTLRRFLTHIVKAVEAPLSLPFSLHLLRIVLLAQTKILAQINAAKASASVSVGVLSGTAAYEHNLHVSRALDAINKQTTDGLKDKLIGLIKWIFSAYVEDAVVAGVPPVNASDVAPGTPEAKKEAIELLAAIEMHAETVL